MEELIKVISVNEKRVGSRWVAVSEPTEMMIDLNRFEKSFVEERWANERRTNRQYTRLGYFHTRTTVKRDDNYRNVRTFVFPK